MIDNNISAGMGLSSAVPDMPLGFGMRLAQEPSALDTYGSLTNEQKTSVIRHIQSGTTGKEAKKLVIDAVENLKNQNTAFF